MENKDKIRFAKTLSGIYDNFAQSQERPKDFARINIVFRPLPWAIFKGPGFYSEQYYDYSPWNPYRQGIHRLAYKDNIFIVENFDFDNKARLAGSGRNPELLDSLDVKTLKKRCGCSMHFIETTPNHFMGGVEPGNECLVPRDGELTYLVSEVEVNQHSWVSRDRGFDPKTNQVKWGSEHGPLKFQRIEDISDIVTSMWIEEEKQ
ncbi:putative phycoerythrobilin:phycoerythrin lyase CpeT [Synechococcus sp. BIOS-U3-1]|uniref:chromophore lyase CpcT/CpeT n=1 Tax=Synechococcus sp. BIOS-U3-1 TaxID=1400865 RepID=UPI0016457E6F|nr:chromophore lyase CpcT/CpeT [Synechococcus sp. BIOS-U3-1]QNI57481.1 putative phycoerythrobilin:phycoerythrin lyase CpeT [Synechococcus sp. BIOS-U3-1]|tara:strand:+ start:661 stop:1275 length:615 start_codon:yes stop_codon:yes gene_type:complete